MLRVECERVAPESGCRRVFEAEDEDELLRQVAEHARDDHGIEPTAEMHGRIRESIERL